MTQSLIEPQDEHNARLVSHVHPDDWTNPTPSGPYNLVVIGAGTAGLVTAAGAAGLGAKVALVERHLMGGDCLNVGCVPSKAVISSARVAATVRDAGGHHVGVGEWGVDFAAVMERMRRLRASIAPVDSAARFRSLGVDVFIGEAAFEGEGRVRVGETTLGFARAVIATGGRAVVPDIPGLAECEPLTNETVFELTQRPRRMLVLGGGPIGCEMAQALQRLGTQVLLVERSGRVLSSGDAEGAALVQESLAGDGVWVFTDAQLQRVDRRDGRLVAQIGTREGVREETVDRVLVGAGRRPNIEGLNLDRVGVEADEQTGVRVDDFLRTTNPAIFAAGDVCSRLKFTHAADFMARTVIQNALVASYVRVTGWKKMSDLIIPHATYTSPELAGIGHTEASAKDAGVDVDVYRVEMAEVDRAILEGRTEGFVKILTRRGGDRIVGATIVCENAGDLIGSVSLAMTQRIGLGAIASSIHPYPTVAEAIRRCGDAYNKTRLTPLAKTALDKFTSITR